jgi:hypothetical protein
MADVRLPRSHLRALSTGSHSTAPLPVPTRPKWHCADNRRGLEEVLRFEVVHQVTRGHENAPNHLNRAP